MRVYKVSLLSGTDRSKGSRRQVLWSARVEAAGEGGARLAAQRLHEASMEAAGRRSFWHHVAAVGRIKVEEVR